MSHDLARYGIGVLPSQSSATSVSWIILTMSAVGAQVVRCASKCGASIARMTLSVCASAVAATARPAAKTMAPSFLCIVASLSRQLVAVAGLLLQSRIQHVAQRIAQQIGGEHDGEDDQARNGRDMWRHEQEVAPLRRHHAELRGRRLRTQAEEAEPRADQDDLAEA